jgi:hypothetical protein
VTDDLITLAELALAEMRRRLVNDESLPLFMAREPDGQILTIRTPPDCGKLMNDGQAKDAIFGWFRACVKRNGWTAFIFASEAWYSESTPEGIALGEQQLCDLIHDTGMEAVVKAGLMTRSEVVMVSVQTKTRVLMVRQTFTRERRRVIFGERDSYETGIDEFVGRQKMYGDLREENLG